MIVRRRLNIDQLNSFEAPTRLINIDIIYIYIHIQYIYLPWEPNNPWKLEGFFFNPQYMGSYNPLKMKVLGSHGKNI